MTRILGNVVFEIRMNRRSKSKIVHVDKLAPVKGEYDNSWVFKMPKKLLEAKPYEDLEGVSNLFENSAVPVTSPVIVSASPTRDMGTSTEVTLPIPNEDVQLAPDIIAEHVPIELDPDVDSSATPELDPKQSQQKTTRSGKSYLVLEPI